MSDAAEEFQCNDCGETYTWTGSNECPFCYSKNIGPIEDGGAAHD